MLFVCFVVDLFTCQIEMWDINWMREVSYMYEDSPVDCPRVYVCVYTSKYFEVYLMVKVLALRIGYIGTRMCTRSIQGSGSRYSFLCWLWLW